MLFCAFAVDMQRNPPGFHKKKNIKVLFKRENGWKVFRKCIYMHVHTYSLGPLPIP